MRNTNKMLEKLQPMDGSIWGNRGPHGQSFGSFTLNPLYTSCLICRAPSDQVRFFSLSYGDFVFQAGRCWMDALELSFKCTGLLKRTMITVGHFFQYYFARNNFIFPTKKTYF